MDQEVQYQPGVKTIPCVSLLCFKNLKVERDSEEKEFHTDSQLARQRGIKWKRKKTCVKRYLRIFLTTKYFHTSSPAPTKPGTNMSPPPRLLKFAGIFPQTKFHLMQVPIRNYFPSLSPCSFFQGCAATKLYLYVFIPLVSITAGKKKKD